MMSYTAKYTKFDRITENEICKQAGIQHKF